MDTTTPRFDPKRLQQATHGLLLYRSIWNHDVGSAWLYLVDVVSSSALDATELLAAYGLWFEAVAGTGKSWPDLLVELLLGSTNPFSQQAQQPEQRDFSEPILAAVRQDLQRLQYLYHLPLDQLAAWIQGTTGLPEPPVVWQLPSHGLSPPAPDFATTQDWTTLVPELIQYYRQRGVGVLAQYSVLRWNNDGLQGTPTPDPVQLDQLVGYDNQKQQLVQNTQFLLQGYPALNVLLYGSRGTGKSSLIKALVNAYAAEGLRLIEVPKQDLQHLPHILEQVRGVPQKVIIFVDDLSFEEDDDVFKALKVVLEGGTTARPTNVVVYATSNRRHLIREFFDERPRPQTSDEIHQWDTVQEKLSFSDRFGLTLTFEPTDQTKYLEIVRHLAQQAKISLSDTELDFRARQWATRHNGRSGRTAQQFVTWLQAEQATS
ncbi:MAG: ATP-binding protein [Cyanobacteria bacterium P01_H01_bin.121]